MDATDHETFNALKTRMKDKFPILLKGYLNDSKTYLATIDSNIPDGDLNAVIEAAHSMKSASGLLGMRLVHQAAGTLEYKGKGLQEEQPAAPFETLRPLYETLNTHFLEIENHLVAELNNSH